MQSTFSSPPRFVQLIAQILNFSKYLGGGRPPVPLSSTPMWGLFILETPHRQLQTFVLEEANSSERQKYQANWRIGGKNLF